MPGITLTNPIAGTTATAGLITANNNALVTLLNLGLDAANFAAGKIFDPAKINEQYGPTLPASPTDGQTAILVDSVTAPTYQWRFRWNAGSVNTDKWEFVGGTPAVGIVSTGEATTSGTYVDLATVGPSFTAPRAGVYSVAWSFVSVESGAGGGNAQAGLFKGAVDQSQAAITNVTGTAGAAMSATRLGWTQTLAASDVLKLKYLISNAISVSFSSRTIVVTPIRVS